MPLSGTGRTTDVERSNTSSSPPGLAFEPCGARVTADPSQAKARMASMPYLSLYRKYRPQTFDDILGQGHVSETLASAITEDRVAHAYLFTGPRGTGKTSMARILAKALNCERGPTPNPCGKCASCVAIAEGSSLDVIELDAASHSGVDET